MLFCTWIFCQISDQKNETSAKYQTAGWCSHPPPSCFPFPLPFSLSLSHQQAYDIQQGIFPFL